MRTRHALVTAAAGGALAVALIASPASATATQGMGSGPGNGQGSQGAQGTGACDGTGQPTTRGAAGQDGAMRGSRSAMGTATHAALSALPSGELTDAQTAALASMAEEEKLAHDLYAAFADTYSVRTFSRIAAAETRHLDAVRLLMDRYDVTDPTAGKAAGEFTAESIQEAYDTQLRSGSASLDAAYAVGVAVETADIDALEAASAGLTAPDVVQVYTTMLAASERHLAAFGG